MNHDEGQDQQPQFQKQSSPRSSQRNGNTLLLTSRQSHLQVNSTNNNSISSINSLTNNGKSNNSIIRTNNSHLHPHSYQNPCVLSVIQGHPGSSLRRFSDLSILPNNGRRIRTCSATNADSLQASSSGFLFPRPVVHGTKSFHSINNNNSNWSSVINSGIINECTGDITRGSSPRSTSKNNSLNNSRTPSRNNVDDDPVCVSVSDSYVTNEDFAKASQDTEESIWSSLKELLFAFLLAGLGNIAASYWYGKVQSWSVFKNIPQLVILVTPLLGLKGNVEMTLASRLSTHANIGDMDDKTSRNKLLMGNIALIQCQASTVGFIAPLIALGLSLLHDQSRILSWKQVVLLVASSVITANVANLILGSLMCFIIILCRRFKVNPDNIATPIAASLGDVTTMILLANISHFLYVNLESNTLVQNTLLIFLMSLIPIWAYIARKNPFTKSVILNGWYPVCGAMLIQNAGGLVMERALKSFNKIANLQLLINGVGGNLVAIQSSRMSTYLHKYSVIGDKKGNDDEDANCKLRMKINPLSTFSSNNPHSKFALLLLAISVPSHLLFLFLTEVVNRKYFFTPFFISIYLLVGVTQVVILLQFAYKFVHWLWSVKVNPDNSAIPFLTAFADLIGSLFLATAFNILYALKDPNAFTPNSVIPDHHGLLESSLPVTAMNATH